MQRTADAQRLMMRLRVLQDKVLEVYHLAQKTGVDDGVVDDILAAFDRLRAAYDRLIGF